MIHPATALASWFRQAARDLPWRVRDQEKPDPYRTWISEVMLQQTQVATVVPYFVRWMKRFPTVDRLAMAPLDEVLRLWSGLGYYRRARALHAAAQVIRRLGWPSTHDGWLELPGIGPYTAGAIASIALGLPTPIVDGNVRRVLARWKGTANPGPRRLWQEAARFLREGTSRGCSAGDINQGLMELGALLCRPGAPSCAPCPLQATCEAHRRGIQGKIPAAKARPPTLRRRERRYAWLHGSTAQSLRILLVRTRRGSWRRDLWDLPSRPPDPENRAVRSRVLKVTTLHSVTRHRIERTTWVVRVARPQAQRDANHRWVKVTHLRGEGVGAPALHLASALAALNLPADFSRELGKSVEGS